MRRALPLACILACSLAWAGEASLSTGAMTLPENRWTKVADCPPDPLARELQPGRGAYWCFEPGSGRFFRYGGYTPTDCNALWSFDLTKRKWNNLLKVNYSWPPPADRPGAGAWWSACYDSKRKVVWMHGGSGVAGRHNKALFEDMWQYDPAGKTFKAMKSKKWPRYSARIVYDSKNDLVLRSPAYDREWAAMHNRDRTWVYSPNANAWEGRATKGSPKAAGGGVWVYDASAGKAVFLALTGKGEAAPTWTYDAAAGKWEKLDVKPSPPARVYAGCAYDPENKATIVYGGIGHPGKGYGYAHRGGGLVLNDTWALDLARKKWTKLEVGAPAVPALPGNSKRRFVLRQAMDYDSKNKAIVVSAPTFGVWALRYSPKGAKKLPALRLAALPAFEKPKPPAKPVFKKASPNRKLLDLAPGKWVKLGGGGALGGGEVPLIYDEATGFCLKYGGCNDGGTTFASGYGNDLCAFDPALERWIALRWTDPCAPPRPANGCTRSYTYDPANRVNWFLGGTSGNHLASSLPLGFSGKGGTWHYDGLKDKYVLVPSSGRDNGTGVVSCYDKSSKLIVAPPKQAWQRATVAIFDPVRKAWGDGAKTRATAYTYGCYVDTLRLLFVVEPGKGGYKTLTYSAAGKSWKELSPKGDKLPVAGRGYVTAYDPEGDVVLCVVKGQTFAYLVKENKWQNLEIKAPVGELMTFDSRHKVFLGCSRGRPMHAYKYK